MPKTRFHTIRLVEETGSTNADLLREAAEGAGEGTVLIARHQVAGRGRQGRIWLDQPDAALLMSWTLRPSAELAPWLPLVTGTAVVRALHRVFGVSVGLKWPNDVLVPPLGEKKLAGILAEAVTIGSDLTVVVGMGLNLEFTEPLPADVADRAVDLATLLVAGGHEVEIDRAELVAALLTELDEALVELETGGGEAALTAYRPLCLTLGREVRFTTAGGEIVGRAVDLDSSGGLVIDEATSGRRIVVNAGDAHHV